MPKKNRLRELSRELPPPSMLSELLTGLYKAPDFTAVLVSTSVLETALERLLLKKMAELSKADTEALFGSRGPLSDLNSKIRVAQAFKVVGGGMAEQLHAIREIRNLFAHARTPIDFDHPDVRAAVARFRLILAMAPSHPDEVGIAQPNKQGFLLCVRIVTELIDHEQTEAGGERLLSGPSDPR